MYCTKCGKQIDYDAPICLECTAALAIQAKQEREAQKAREAEISAPVIDPAPVTPSAPSVEPAPAVDPAPPIESAPAVESISFGENLAEPTPAAEPKSDAEESAPTRESTPIAEPKPAAEQTSTVTYPFNGSSYDPKTAPWRNTRKEGFGKALASTIIGGCLSLNVGFTLGLYWTDVIFLAVISGLISIGMAVVSIILGIQSIKTFVRVKNAGDPPPVATLVLGIVGVALSAEALLIGLTYLSGGEGIEIYDYINL